MASNMGIGSKKGRIQLAVVKESERKILSLQADLTLLVARYQVSLSRERYVSWCTLSGPYTQEWVSSGPTDNWTKEGNDL